MAQRIHVGITGYGVANLYGVSEPERAEALIDVAHPDFCDDLTKAAREREQVNKKIFWRYLAPSIIG